MDLSATTLDGPRSGPHVLITGGVHGDEFEPIAAIRQLGLELSGAIRRGRATLVPVVNESAYRLGRRTGEDGLDLARCCPGNPGGSATERAAHALSRLIRTADAYIDLHAGGIAMTVYPLAGYMLHPDSVVLERQRRMAQLFGLPVIWGTDPTLEGRSLSVARDARVPAIYAEFLGGGRCDPGGVAAYVRGCRNLLIDLGMIDGEIIPASEQPIVVEDRRPASGILQFQHPSPIDGVFEPAVVLGAAIQEGAPLGIVSDPIGGPAATVLAARGGIVLALRSLARVAAGEGLAVVLDPEALSQRGPIGVGSADSLN